MRSEHNLKVGDKLAFHSHYHGYEIQRINKITPSGRLYCGRIHGGKNRYILNADLSIRGQDSVWHGPHRGEIVTDKIRASILRKNILYKLSKVKWDKYTTGQLQAVLAVLPSEEPTNDN